MSKKIINITAAAMALAVTLSGCATAVVQERKGPGSRSSKRRSSTGCRHSNTGTDSRTDPGTHQCLVFVVESPGFHARHAGQS